MKRILILGIVLLLITAIACRQEVPAVDVEPGTDEVPVEQDEQPETQPETTEPTEADEPAEADQEPEPTVGRTEPERPLPSERQETEADTETAEPKKELNPKIKDLLKRKNDKLKSVQFLYGGTATGNLFLDTYMIKGEKVKVKKFSEDYYVRDGYYDTVYVNEAIACCEEQKRCESHNVDNTNVSFEPSEKDMAVPKTPMQWMDEIQPNAEVIGPQTVDERSVTYLVYTNKQGQEVHMWVDDTYGVPHKVEIREGETMVEKHQYNDMRFNSLTEEAFEPPCADLPRA